MSHPSETLGQFIDALATRLAVSPTFKAAVLQLFAQKGISLDGPAEPHRLVVRSAFECQAETQRIFGQLRAQLAHVQSMLEGLRDQYSDLAARTRSTTPQPFFLQPDAVLPN